MSAVLSDPHRELSEKSDIRTVYLLIAVIAIVIVFTIIYSTHLSTRAANVFVPRIDAAHEIRTSSAIAHLWAEEVLLNDPNVNSREVMQYHETAYNLTDAMLQGGSVHGKTFAPVNDKELRDLLELTKKKIEHCIKVTTDRFALKDSAGAGTDIDQELDLAFNDLLSTAAKVEERVHIVIGRDMKLFYFIQSALIVSCILLSLIVTGLVYRAEKRRNNYIIAIQEKNAQLQRINHQLTAAEQQLTASNQQLMASEQQLKATNQQLMASEQQLKATNQQLMASEQQLRASESRYRTLFEDMAEGVALHRVIYDQKEVPVNYEIISVNPQYERTLNIPSGQVLGKLATEAYQVSEPPYLAEFARVAQTGDPYQFETYFPPMKKHFFISVSTFEKGYFATIFSDITSRKKAEEAIRLNEERLQILWDMSQYKAGSIRDLLDYALEKAIQLTGSKIGYIYHYNEKTKEFVLNSWSAGVMNECKIREKETTYLLDRTGIWGEAVRQGKPIILNDYQAHHPLKKGCPEGHASLLRFLTIPVHSGRRITAVVGVANKTDEYDENDVKQLTLFMDSVWKLVERHELNEEHVRLQTQVQKLESLGILAGGIAHDFNNLLTAMLANINLVSFEMKDDEKISKRLSDAEKACLRAQGLTKQLLTFASGGAPVKHVLHPEEVVRESALLALRGASVSCDLSFAKDLWPVEADEGQLGQVIGNLVINAVQAMPEGGTVRVSAENSMGSEGDGLRLEEAPYVKISVADSGIGILREHLHKIFDPYFTTKQSGSGLGLAVSYSIVQKHGGHIAVESTPGQGATFHIYLPASPGKFNKERVSGHEIIAGKGHILLMEDEEMVSDAAGAILKEYGYDVAVAREGKEALEMYAGMMASGTPFDLVIMDLTIPGGMGGKEAIGKLLKIDPQAKAIVSSGYSNDPVMADYRTYGFRGIIAKPYKVHELFAVLNTVMNEGQEPEVSYRS